MEINPLPPLKDLCVVQIWKSNIPDIPQLRIIPLLPRGKLCGRKVCTILHQSFGSQDLLPHQLFYSSSHSLWFPSTPNKRPLPQLIPIPPLQPPPEQPCPSPRLTVQPIPPTWLPWSVDTCIRFCGILLQMPQEMIRWHRKNSRVNYSPRFTACSRAFGNSQKFASGSSQTSGKSLRMFRIRLGMAVQLQWFMFCSKGQRQLINQLWRSIWDLGRNCFMFVFEVRY